MTYVILYVWHLCPGADTVQLTFIFQCLPPAELVCACVCVSLTAANSYKWKSTVLSPSQSRTQGWQVTSHFWHLTPDLLPSLPLPALRPAWPSARAERLLQSPCRVFSTSEQTTRISFKSGTVSSAAVTLSQKSKIKRVFGIQEADLFFLLSGIVRSKYIKTQQVCRLHPALLHVCPVSADPPHGFACSFWVLLVFAFFPPSAESLFYFECDGAASLWSGCYVFKYWCLLLFFSAQDGWQTLVSGLVTFLWLWHQHSQLHCLGKFLLFSSSAVSCKPTKPPSASVQLLVLLPPFILRDMSAVPLL